MLCVASLIVFAVLGLFSARYRRLAGKAWRCVLRRVVFKPCDVNFQEEVKSRLLGALIFRAPRLARLVDRWSGLLSLLFVAASLASLLLALNGGLNLLVYDTCDRNDTESCALAGDACGIASGRTGFWAALRGGQTTVWVAEAAADFAETISRIPDRLKYWEPAEYVHDDSSYYRRFDPGRPIALEIIDPGCRFCAKLFRSIQETGFADRYNLTYLVYPIPDRTAPAGDRFPHSRLIASYLEAVKRFPHGRGTAADWQILERLFVGRDAANIPYQTLFNMTYTAAEAERLLDTWLAETGYTETERTRIRIAARSEEVRSALERQRQVVEHRIRTVKIPTLIFAGRRYDRAVSPETLLGRN